MPDEVVAGQLRQSKIRRAAALAGAFGQAIRLRRNSRLSGARSYDAPHFFRQHRDILSLPRGAGYWLWKPYYIQQVLREAAPGDVVAYIDSGIEIIADLKPVVEICTAGRGITLFQVHDGYNIIWTKRSCLVGMNCDEPRYHWAQQVMGGFQLYRHCPETLRFSAHVVGLLLPGRSC